MFCSAVCVSLQPLGSMISGEKKGPWIICFKKKTQQSFGTSLLLIDPLGLHTNLSKWKRITNPSRFASSLIWEDFTASLTPSEHLRPDKQHHNNRHKKRGGQHWFFRYTTEHSGRAHTVSLFSTLITCSTIKAPQCYIWILHSEQSTKLYSPWWGLNCAKCQTPAEM